MRRWKERFARNLEFIRNSEYRFLIRFKKIILSKKLDDKNQIKKTKRIVFIFF
ncbi:hypothetical protein LEP1GSC060_1789 [Leptospira weilii serovar Ranarum str. ICFT]|uniref:Uncharacterized protein n=1 Tax=Leptospira weilii serovar Ranarum str. ICFT TaxID=1218598 RepID=N1WQC7_9LEPT|nr:hypothetical protein LEP1GSC060_1789 [Leptospira weilii serovar Ranarum str. ICFT]